MLCYYFHSLPVLLKIYFICQLIFLEDQEAPLSSFSLATLLTGKPN
jgi:hypothetical protein